MFIGLGGGIGGGGCGCGCGGGIRGIGRFGVFLVVKGFGTVGSDAEIEIEVEVVEGDGGGFVGLAVVGIHFKNAPRN